MCQIKTQPGQQPTETAVVEYNTYRDAPQAIQMEGLRSPVFLRVQLATFIPPVDAPYATIKAQYEMENPANGRTETSPIFNDLRYQITEKQATCPSMKIALEMVADAIQGIMKDN
jgi:hypothetical protein